ncbi:hypothetical protein OAN29_02465, partial [Pelagibacteraceae bacterium]|nr:hypothetical protein [Pelagibacteraceae bacterium]
FFSAGDVAVSNNDKLLGYSIDDKGSEYFTIYVRKISDKKIIEEPIVETAGGITWAYDDLSFFYSKLDNLHRPRKIYQHKLGTPVKEDKLIYEEKDERFTCGISTSSDEKYYFVSTSEHTTSEVYYIDKNDNNLEPKIFIKREALEIKSLEKYVLSQQRESYEEVQQRIDKIKEKYKSLREQKINEAIRERVANLGITVEDTDDKATLLEKERIYNAERQKIEYALESFYRSAHSLCFQLNKKYIPKYLSIIRCIDKRFETGEIYIKWDDSIEEDWLILIYIKNNSPNEGIIIEDKSNPEKNMTYEFQSNEIFKASDVMVDALTKLLDNERNKRKVN